MLTYTVHPRFGETDQLGHVHHLSIPSWFEEARNPIFRWFNPDFYIPAWNLILVRIEVDYVGQVHFSDSDVEIRSWITYIGNTSFHVAHGAYLPDGRCVALGGVVLIHFDFDNQKPIPIPESIRQILEEHYDENAPYKMAIHHH
ncbi:MAG: thioesterase family protein [Planctomycetia bacterium]|nr:thioesterase family protein [Planctomycetia bacterium]